MDTKMDHIGTYTLIMTILICKHMNTSTQLSSFPEIQLSFWLKYKFHYKECTC